MSCESMAQNELTWKHRMIYLQSNDQDLVNEQIAHFRNHEKELDERKIIVFTRIDKSILKGLEMEKALLPNELRQVPKNIFFTLIGLDGGIKMSSQGIVHLEKLNNIIDGMPMRQNELKLREY